MIGGEEKREEERKENKYKTREKREI